MPTWCQSFSCFLKYCVVDEEFDAMPATYAVPYVDELYQMDDSYPGMSELEVMTLTDMYSGFTASSPPQRGYIDPLVDWWTLKPREKKELADAFWLQYLDDTAEVY